MTFRFVHLREAERSPRAAAGGRGGGGGGGGAGRGRSKERVLRCGSGRCAGAGVTVRRDGWIDYL